MTIHNTNLIKRLSIIVPMYNVAPYVERCIRSLEDQDIPKDDYELICINDGSPDACREIVEKLQKEFFNIILINQINQGVSCARNNGIDKATGKYLLFVDPDDYVDANCFDRILKTADEQQTQVCFLGYTFLNEDGNVRKMVTKDEFRGKVYPGIEAYFIAHSDGYTDPDKMVAVLFETKFLLRNNLRYLPYVPYLEDGEFIARILCLAERCIFDGHSFYQRTTRPGSATNSNLYHSKYAINGFLKAAINLRNFRDTMALKQKQKVFMNQPIVKFVVLTISAASKPINVKKLVHLRKELYSNKLYKVNLEKCNKFYTELGTVYNISFLLFVIYYYFRNIFVKLYFFVKK